MEPTTERDDESQGRWLGERAVGIYTAAVGLLLLAPGIALAFLQRGGAAAVALVSVGAAALILAPIFSRIERLEVTGKGFSVWLRREVQKRIGEASMDTLEGILPMLTSENVWVRVGVVPKRFDGMTLKDLPYIRQDLLISVVALEEVPGRWLAGGAVTDRPLREGERMLMAGPSDIIESFVLVMSDPDDRRFEQELEALKSRGRLLKEQWGIPTPEPSNPLENEIDREDG
jgi:hypothetical protein